MKFRCLALLSALLILSPELSVAQLKKAEDAKAGETKEKEKPARSAQELERIHQRNHRKAEEAWGEDKKKRSAKDFAQLETEYQEINKNYKSPNVKSLLEAFIKKWKDGNRVGCATLYLAQKSSGPEKEKLLETCIKKFSDAYYLNGCSVGGLARLQLAAWCQQSGKASEAKKLIEEIEKSYADAEDHSNNIIGDQAAALKKK
ncbi:MAG TPA: hypothetical protein VG796_21680 [Verrucomicrobiales bacterium]|jgi:hypothetical protein|nr:hypothetical protein [Verrucomicrobiales bacterium]